MKGRLIPIHINGRLVSLDESTQTGAALKRLARCRPDEVLFREGPREDEVIGDGVQVVVQRGDRFHCSPPADYGGSPAALRAVPSAIVPQPGGWRLAVFEAFELPSAYQPERVKLLIKLPPLFPEAQPDMFWLSPSAHLRGGAPPKGTSPERLLGEPWQRFSWHLKAGAWRPGRSTLTDFIRCVRARLARGD